MRDRLGVATADLPDEAEAPVVAKVSGDAQPILWITLTGPNRSQLELTELAERQLTEPLSVLSGAARVIVVGARRKAMRIWMDLEGMAARGVTVSDVTDALRAENVELSADRIEGRMRELSVRGDTRLTSLAEFRQQEALAIIRQRSAMWRVWRSVRNLSAPRCSSTAKPPSGWGWSASRRPTPSRLPTGSAQNLSGSARTCRKMWTWLSLNAAVARDTRPAGWVPES